MLCELSDVTLNDSNDGVGDSGLITLMPRVEPRHNVSIFQKQIFASVYIVSIVIW